MNDFQYVGKELELFADVVNWKAYWASRCEPHISGDVLEVGAGLGGSTALMIRTSHESWTCLEPDIQLAAHLAKKIAEDSHLAHCKLVVGSTVDLEVTPCFDTLIYVDVLEHIDNDREELERAARILRPGGKLIVVAPAFQFLLTPFDDAVGHFRRYEKQDLDRLQDDALQLAHFEYLDSVGMLAALVNRTFLRQSMPSKGQLAFWDRVIIPCSRVVDRLVKHRFGKSVLIVWSRL